MTDFETELLQTRHRLEEAQARNRVKDCKSRTRMLIQKINSGNGNTTDNADNDKIVGELFMGSIQTNTMVSIKSLNEQIQKIDRAPL